MVDAANILVSLIGSLTLLSLAAYIGLVSWGRSELLYFMASSHPGLRWYQSSFFLLAGAGLIVCLYQGADFMLSWMPETWRNAGEDGEYTTLRSFLAGLFAIAAGLFFCQFTVRATHDKFDLRQVALRESELRSLLDTLPHTGAQQLAERARRYEARAAELILTRTQADKRQANVYLRLAEAARTCEAGFIHNAENLEYQLRSTREQLRHEEETRIAAEARERQRAAAGEWELDYLRRNPGARVVVKGGEESQSGSYSAVRELLSPSGEVVRSSSFGMLAD